MHRRGFLGRIMTAGMLSARPRAGANDAPPLAPVTRAAWIEDGIIDAGGSHEPLSFVVRRGGYRLDARERYERAQSEALIRRLKEQGVEVFHTHLYKGFGMAAEMPEMRDTVAAARFAHSLGMKVDTYVQWNTLMYETFFVEEPRAKEWIQRDSAGRPILLPYGYQQSFRYRPCFANREYLDYIRKIVRFAVAEVRTDFIHFDNFDLNPEPDSCHCAVCVKAFRERLNRKYSAAQRKERFGFENLEYVNPPEWNAQNPPEKMRIVSDPVIQEWIDFRCQVMADALQETAAYAKSINPEVVIEVNPHGITGGNRAWEAAIDHSRILKSTQVFWTEESNKSGLRPDGRLISKIRSYKLARAYRNTLLTYIDGNPLAAAECLAFNQTIGYAGNDPLSDGICRSVAFYRRHREYFTGTEDVADVAVLRSYASITYHHARAQLAAVLTEQALIESHVPFDLVFDEHLRDLSKYRVLILPESECLSDVELDAIRKFVQGGGGLVAIGAAGLYDEWRRVRVAPGLEGLIDRQPGARQYDVTESMALAGEATGPAQRKQLPSGRTVYLPSLRFDGPIPPMGQNFEIRDRFWRFPANGEELVEEVRWAAGGAFTVELSGPRFLVANLVGQPRRNRMCLHLVNYSEARKLSEDIEVRLRLPAGAKAAGVRLLAQEYDEPRALASRMDGGAVLFTVPGVSLYAFAAVSW